MSKLDKIGVLIAFFGALISAITKNWVTLGLWTLVIIQDFRARDLELTIKAQQDVIDSKNKIIKELGEEIDGR